MKKIINNPRDVVGECLQGLAESESGLLYVPGAEVIARREKAPGKVGLSQAEAPAMNRRLPGMWAGDCSRPRWQAICFPPRHRTESSKA